MNQKGIGSHLQAFYNSINSNKNISTPPPDIKQSLQSLKQILQDKISENTQHLQSHHKLLNVGITSSQLEQLQVCRKQYEQNLQTIKILEINRELDHKLINYEDSIMIGKTLEDRLKIFREIYTFIILLVQELDGIANASILKVQFLRKLKKKIQKIMIDCFYYRSQNGKQLEEALTFFHLPNKPPQKGKSKQNKIPNDDLFQKEEANHYCKVIVEALFTQYTCYCLVRQIQLFLEEENKDCGQTFSSTFFKKLWEKISKSLSYIFINPYPNLSNESAYQIDEPQWMFEYMQAAFLTNSKFLEEKILKRRGNTKQIQQCIKTYIISFNIREFFMKHIIQRLETDINFMQQEQIVNSHFIIYNFLEEVHFLEDKISVQYDYDVNFVESVLTWGQNNWNKLKQQQEFANQKKEKKKNSNSESLYDLLKQNFDYEHQWFEKRIFQDFIYIDYSKVVDIRNIEAYNIVINFIQLFQKMYAKFKKVQSIERNGVNLKQKINNFYFEIILKLVRQIMNSFSRTTKNLSQQDSITKYQVLMGFKKVEDQFRQYFRTFLQVSPQYQRAITEQYYNCLKDDILLYILQVLNPLHIKIQSLFTKITGTFSKQQQEDEMDEEKSKAKTKMVAKWKKIVGEWEGAMDKIIKIQPQYSDTKTRNKIFVFVQATEFSQRGFNLFIDFSEPFLTRIFKFQGFQKIKMLCLMEKSTRKQFIQTHHTTLTFLKNSEIKIIQELSFHNINAQKNQSNLNLLGLIGR